MFHIHKLPLYLPRLWNMVSKMRILILVVVVYLHAQVGFGQVLTVLDFESKKPLEMVAIISQKNKLAVYTDGQGNAEITAFKDFEKIELRLFGYTPLIQSFSELSDLNFMVYLNPSLINLQQAVVSATRWSQNRQEIPARITTITNEERDLLNPQTAADLLGISGEVFIQKSQQGGGSPMIRGFSTNRLLYSVDGVRMNSAIYRSGNLQNVISLDPFAIESTEIFFGPGSIIYGSDAIGAVMSFQTLQPEFSETDKMKLSGNANLRTTTANNEKTGHFHLKYGNKKWAGVSSITHYDFDDLRMGSNGPKEFLRPTFVERIDNQDVLVENSNPKIQVPSGYSQLNLMQKIRFSPNEKWDFTYAFHYSETSDYPRFDRLIRFRPNGQPRSAEWFYGPQKWMMNHLKISNSSPTKYFDSFHINLGYQVFEESRIDRNFNDPIRRNRAEKVGAFSANMDFLKNLSSSAKIFYGAEWVKNDVTSIGLDEDIDTGEIKQGPARYPNAIWNSYAVYTTYQKKITPQSLIQTGLRYNIFSLQSDFENNTAFYPLPYSTANNENSALIANAGWVFTPTGSWMMHLNASTGFRAPNVDDIGKFFDAEPGTVLVPNPDLKPEYAYNAEINVSKVFGEKAMIDITGYYTYLDNAIVRRNFTLNGLDSILYDGELSKVLALQNASFVQIIGLQAALEIKFSRLFTLNSKLNLQKGTEETDDGDQSPSRHAPPTFGVTRLEYSKNKWRLQLFSEYSGGFTFDQLPLEERGKPELYAQDDNGNPYSPPWATINMKGLYELNKFVSLSLGFENLTDVRFRTYSSGIAAPGRNFIISLMGNF